jgi:hypothetical protein
MPNTGVELKKELGLSDLPYVRISRLLATSLRTYIVWYNTRRWNVPITQRMVRGWVPSMAYRWPFEERPRMTPLMAIEDFNAELRNALFFTVDLAGEYGDPKRLTHIIESYGKEKRTSPRPLMQGRLQEFLRMDDLRNDDPTPIIRRTRRTRNQELGKENTLAKLSDIDIDTQNGHVTFIWLTEVTEPIYPDDYDFGEVDPNSSFRIKQNRSKTYEIYIRILDFFDWLDTTPEDKEKITNQDLKDIFDTANIQIFSTSPHFHWAGFNYYASQLDASIYPTNIEPEWWNHPNRHGSGPYLMDKHIMGLVRNIKFWYGPMAQMLTRRLKKRGVL